MDNHISPEITAILNQLDAMKDSVIIAGRTAVDQNNESHATISALRCELQCANKEVVNLRMRLKTETKIAEVSTISMIIGWSLAVAFIAGWMLS